MASENIKTADEVISDFLDAQSQDTDLDADTLAVIGALRGEGKLSKINLLRQLEELRKSKLDGAAGAGDADG